MQETPIEIILIVAEVLEKMGISYLVCGSLASSIHGIARATRDVDIVAAFTEKDLTGFVTELQDKFYVDSEMIHEAIKRRASFNLVHLESMFKIDIYVLKQDAFSNEEFARRKKIEIDQNHSKSAYIATPEDTILSKLIWYKKGKEISDRQWQDILGIIKVQGERLDMKYLHHWAKILDLEEIFKRILREANLKT